MSAYQPIFDAIVRDPRYLANLDSGEPRSGHPEGTIRAHIEELDANLERVRDRLDDESYWKLKILIHVHDSFKPQAKAGVAIQDARSHASLARSFLAEFCDDADLQAMAHLHDEPYALWRQDRHKGRFDSARFEMLVTAISDWNLFLTFCIIDGCTAGKDRAPLEWLFARIDGRVDTRVSARDIL